MTKRQNDLLIFIRGYIAEHTFSPTYEEMRAAVGLKAKSGVHRLVNALVAQGKLIKHPGGSRVLSLVAFDLSSLTALSSQELRTVIAHASGLLAHRDGGGQAAAVLARIGDRLTGKPRVKSGREAA